MIAKDDPDYMIEEYKGRIIASHKNNVSQKSMNNIIIVYDKLDFPITDFTSDLMILKVQDTGKWNRLIWMMPEVILIG
ncbi:hypothetical protein EGY07_11860 [Chryseobacterium indologenes]|uniref:hypothetical protein n=1 Tax=Chryseobacterium indologenes TaxID=253 RepID=UPI000F4F7532|nr:hypothetical protein [Chryseobacterium indologenes]AYZ36228.1 hypothetical protein EGY07_11860 [Chryseobacterium indologenes]MEB4760859.1 hypothetical protein [Chryseobacterium indologenes]